MCQAEIVECLSCALENYSIHRKSDVKIICADRVAREHINDIMLFMDSVIFLGELEYKSFYCWTLLLEVIQGCRSLKGKDLACSLPLLNRRL